MTTQMRKKYALRLSSFQLRNDALIIGPTGELIEAHTAGNGVPAIPQPIVGRIPANPGDTAHILPDKSIQPVVVTFTGSSTTPGETIVSEVSAQDISTGSSPTATSHISQATSRATVASSSPGISPSASVVPTFSTSAVPSSIAMTTSSHASSATVSPSSSGGPPIETPSTSPVPSKHGTSLSVAVAFAVLAGFAIVVALIVWFTRIRAKSRRQALSERTTWPWDHDGRQLESNYPVSHYGRNEQNAPSLHSVLPLPPGLVGRDEVMHSSHYVPMPQSPYRLVSNDLHQSVYDLAPEMGSLRVANYVPGDSRATSRLGTMAGQQSGSSEGQNASLDEFAMLKHPWPSSRNNSDSSFITEEKKDPYYFSNVEPTQQHIGMPSTKVSPPDNWVSSLRSNIFNAFQVVVGGPYTEPDRDCYTAKPVKVAPASRQVAQAISRHNSARSHTALTRQCSGTGRVIDSNNLSAWLSGPSRQQHDADTNLSVPPLAIVKDRDRDRSTLSRASSVYSTASASRVDSQSTGFELPHIPMSRSGSQSSLQQAFQGKGLHHEMALDTDEAAGPIRNRAHSVRPSISRTASSQSDALTEQEQYASDILKGRKYSSDANIDDATPRMASSEASSAFLEP
ncbi:hypothetical protein BDY19DRAFT_994830 [Irpex rosettiformis]|uniref:Uncharacterized protein n=1 Tax=Irpex rosettiformis TaxID=378272 RepID=A0ACB8TZU9_9APHY|nr:hypothetical protein BDY19DRAFT_994830 [Irpex rosettiformis]